MDGLRNARVARPGAPGSKARRILRSGRLAIGAAAAVVATSCEPAVPAPIEEAGIAITDVAGREVRLAGPATRIVIDDARYLVALSLIHPDPVSVLSGWPHDINRLGEGTYAAFADRFPRIEELARTSSSAGEFSVELTLAARPDLAIFTLGMGPSAEGLAQLEQAGVPVVFLDFFSQPFENLERSLKVLGDVTGRSEQATAFTELRRSRLEAITTRLSAASVVRPTTVFLEAHAGISADCCNSPGRGNIGDYIELLGGHNIGADALPGPTGQLSLEYVISRDPDVYIATGGPHLARAGGLVLGHGYTEETSREALGRMAERRGIAELRAVREGRVHGISHQLMNSPLDILAVEALAKWIHPEVFADLDPRETMATINRDFLAVPLEGAHWVDLNAAR